MDPPRSSPIQSPLSPELSQALHQASTFFVTRRLEEALSVLEAIIYCTSPDHEHVSTNSTSQPELVASAPPRLRIKIWSLYITVLDAILKLGPEKGRDLLGDDRWGRITSKVTDGEIWDDVVKRGYHGHLDAVDADVILNVFVAFLSLWYQAFTHSI